MADLDELERLLAAAAAGEWVVRSYQNESGDHDPVPSWHVFDEDNLIASAALHNAAPALIAAARERDRLRAAVDGVLADVARWREHTEARARGGQHVGTSGEIGQLSHSTAAYLERVLRAAGGGT